MVGITGGFVQIVHRVLRQIHLAALCSGAVSSTPAVPGRLFQDSAISNENYELPRTAISSQRHLHYSTSTFFQDNTIFNENYEPPRTAICPHRQSQAAIRFMSISRLLYCRQRHLKDELLCCQSPESRDVNSAVELNSDDESEMIKGFKFSELAL